MTRRLRIVGCCFLAGLLTEACGGGTEPSDGTPGVGSVQITSSVTALVVGTTIHLAAKVLDNAGHAVTSPTISWSSSDKSVLNVVLDGDVTGLKPGSGYVIAASGGKKDSVRLTVTLTPVAHVTVTPAQDTVGTGLTIQLLASTTSADDTLLEGRAVTWASGDQAIATVSGTGLVKGVHEGVVTIIATSEGVTGSAQVTVAPLVTTVTVTPSLDTLYPDQELQLAAEARDVNGDLVPGVEIEWSSDAETVAGVSATGKVVAWNVGSATVSASVGGAIGTMHLEVVWLPVDSISIFPQAISLVPGATVGFDVRILDSAGRDFTIDPGITVGTNPPGIATANGYQVTGQSLGTTTFWVSADDVTASAQVKVVQVSYASVSAGSVQTCGLSTDGLAFCWGYGLRGLWPYGVVGDHHFDVVGTGAGMSCGLDSGAVLCWGGNPGSGENYPEPTPIPGAPSFTDLIVGDQFGCGLAGDGSAHCWGFNSAGELGDGTLTPSGSPTTVGGGHSFVALAGGRWHACGLTSSGEVYCWGGETNSTTPRLVSGSVIFASISGGYCGLDAAGVAYCWDDTQITPTPTAIPGFTFASLSGRTDQVCGLQADGSAWCWGRDTNAPSAVPGGRQFVSLSTGSTHACGIATDGKLYCWGSGLAIGSGDGYGSVSDPTLVEGQP